jgi:hypothetical protein
VRYFIFALSTLFLACGGSGAPADREYNGQCSGRLSTYVGCAREECDRGQDTNISRRTCSADAECRRDALIAHAECLEECRCGCEQHINRVLCWSRCEDEDAQCLVSFTEIFKTCDEKLSECMQTCGDPGRDKCGN